MIWYLIITYQKNSVFLISDIYETINKNFSNKILYYDFFMISGIYLSYNLYFIT